MEQKCFSSGIYKNCLVFTKEYIRYFIRTTHVDLTVHNTVLLDIWWNMLIKFSKQIGKKSCENN